MNRAKLPEVASWAGMNGLQVIGYRAMRKELWDRQGANIASRWKEMYGEKLFPRDRKSVV